MKYFLYSKTTCLAEVNEKTSEVSNKTPLVLNNGEYVKVYPLENGKLPFCFVAGNQVLQNKNIRATDFGEYTILEIQAQQIFSGEFFKTKIFNGYTASVIGKPFKFNIDNKDKHFSFDCKEILTEISIYENKGLIVLDCLAYGQDYMVCFHKKEEKFYEFYGNVDIKDTKITEIKDKNTQARHGELNEYAIELDKIKLLSSEPIYLNKMPVKVPPFLFHIAFFEAVREKDFELAKSYLTEEFSRKLKTAHFKEFFGEFDQIKPIIENNQHKIALIKKSSPYCQKAKVFTLTFENNLIADILGE